jgi:hypothetical protein
VSFFPFECGSIGSTLDPVELLIISRITWSILWLLRFAFRAFNALCVSSWTLTDFAITLKPVRAYLNVECLTQYVASSSSARELTPDYDWDGVHLIVKPTGFVRDLSLFAEA